MYHKNEFGNEIYVTSRSRTPSLIDVTSQNEGVFAQLPDLIQEAAVSAEFSSPKLRISRVQTSQTVTTDFLTSPMFFITAHTGSGIDLPDLQLTDEKLLSKYGSDLTANFADIKAYGSRAFFQKQNLSDGTTYSLCACATGYIWVHTSIKYEASYPREFSDIEVQIGTFALKARAITTSEIQCRYKLSSRSDLTDGNLSLLCSTVLAKYLQLRMKGQQYEEAAESAILSSRRELAALRVVDPGKYGDFSKFLREICAHAPMPPTSDVSLISRSMINRRWECWSETSVLRRRYLLPRRVIRCFRKSRYDSIDLLSGCFKVLGSEKKRLPIL